jgi:hypothetical protein
MAVADIIRAAADRYGVDPDTLVGMAQIESRLDPSAANKSSSAKGLFQFTDGTRAQYGGFNPFDAEASADAGARLARDNIQVLRNGLGRDPTPGEVYLAHQQGGGGALKLLSNPDAPAASLVGTRAVIQNGGNQGMSARDFSNLWVSKFGGAPATAPRAAPMQNVAQAQPGPTAPSAAGAISDGLGGLMSDIGEQSGASPRQRGASRLAKRQGLDLGALYSSLSPNLVLAS